MSGSSKGASRGYRSGSLGRVLDRRDWGGASAGRDGEVRDGAHGRVSPPGGARRPSAAAGGALLRRAAGVVRGDEGGVGWAGVEDDEPAHVGIATARHWALCAQLAVVLE